MKTAVIIVTFNNQDTILNCLKTLPKKKEFQILIIDNNSKDQTIKIVKKYFPHVQIIRLNKNLGFGAGNNSGVDFVLKQNFDYAMILNPDTILFPDTISNLVKSARKYRDLGIFGPKIFWDKTGKKIWSVGGELDKNRFTAGLIGYQKKDNYLDLKKCDFISGTAMLIPQKLLKKGLRFFEPYFLYYEDVEFCFQARKMGYPSYIVPESQIIHLEESKNKLQNVKNYYLARNHLLFVERHAPFRVKLRETLRLPKTIWQHLKNRDIWALRGISDYFKRNFGKKYAKKFK